MHPTRIRRTASGKRVEAVEEAQGRPDVDNNPIELQGPRQFEVFSTTVQRGRLSSKRRYAASSGDSGSREDEEAWKDKITAGLRGGGTVDAGAGDSIASRSLC